MSGQRSLQFDQHIITSIFPLIYIIFSFLISIKEKSSLPTYHSNNLNCFCLTTLLFIHRLFRKRLLDSVNHFPRDKHTRLIY